MLFNDDTISGALSHSGHARRDIWPTGDYIVREGDGLSAVRQSPYDYWHAKEGKLQQHFALTDVDLAADDWSTEC